MDNYVGFISLGFLIIIQIGLFAFGYGKLANKAENNYHNIGKLENKVEALRDKVVTLETYLKRLDNGK